MTEKNSPSNGSHNCHGGKRPGAGRKKGSGAFGEATKVMRIPESEVPTIQNYLKTLKTAKSLHNKSELLNPAEQAVKLKLPLYSHKVVAGFPSPADDYIETHLDLNEKLIANKNATFLLRVQGDSMQDAGIHDGDILVVDRSLKPENGKIVIAALDGELTVKRLKINNQGTFLAPENPDYPLIEVKAESDMVIWGIVTSSIHHF